MNKLTKIPFEKLQILRQMYGADRTLNSTTINAITNILNRIKKTPELGKRVEFLSLDDNWHRNGTILIKNESRVYFNTLERAPYQSLRSMLDALDVEDEITFVCISDKFREILHDFLWYNNLERIFEEGTSGYWMSNNDAKSLNIKSLPDNYIIKPLNSNHVDEINNECPRDGGDHLNYVKNSIEHKMSIGIFDKHTGELIAWCFEMDYCSIGMGVVKSSKKRNGLGSYAVKSLLKRMANDNNMDITWHVIHGHKISHKFCRSIGGEIFDTFTWLSAKRKCGAVSIHLHMISEQSRGLFHKAILISGSAFIKSWGVIDKSDFAERLARRCGWDGNGGEAKMLEILEKANPHTLMKFGDVTNLFTEDEFSQFMIFGFQPVVEPYVGNNCFLPKDPVLLAQEGIWSTDIPCLIGAATIEGAMFSFLNRNQKTIDLLQKPQYFCPSKELNIDVNSPKALKYGQMLRELYFEDKPVTMKNLEILLDYAGDRQIWHGVYNAIKQRIKAGGKTFMFRFDANTKLNLIKQIGKIEYSGAAHGDMSLYFLSSSYVEAPKSDSIEYKMMEKMTKLIESFLLTGSPNTDAENVVWEPVTDEFNCLTINEKNFEIGAFPKKYVLDVWNSIFEEENVKVY